MSGSRKSLQKAATTFNPSAENSWSKDDSKFGQRMLEKMGWKKGEGIGLNKQGIQENVKIRRKLDTKGFGFRISEDEWVGVELDFSDLLSKLNNNGVKAAASKHSLEVASSNSRCRLHYRRYVHGKDISKYSKEDLSGILGRKEKLNDDRDSEEKDECQVDDSSVLRIFNVDSGETLHCNKHSAEQFYKSEELETENCLPVRKIPKWHKLNSNLSSDSDNVNVENVIELGPIDFHKRKVKVKLEDENQLPVGRKNKSHKLNSNLTGNTDDADVDNVMKLESTDLHKRKVEVKLEDENQLPVGRKNKSHKLNSNLTGNTDDADVDNVMKLESTDLHKRKVEVKLEDENQLPLGRKNKSHKLNSNLTGNTDDTDVENVIKLEPTNFHKRKLKVKLEDENQLPVRRKNKSSKLNSNLSSDVDDVDAENVLEPTVFHKRKVKIKSEDENQLPARRKNKSNKFESNLGGGTDDSNFENIMKSEPTDSDLPLPEKRKKKSKVDTNFDELALTNEIYVEQESKPVEMSSKRKTVVEESTSSTSLVEKPAESDSYTVKNVIEEEMTEIRVTKKIRKKEKRVISEPKIDDPTLNENCKTKSFVDSCSNLYTLVNCENSGQKSAHTIENTSSLLPHKKSKLAGLPLNCTDENAENTQAAHEGSEGGIVCVGSRCRKNESSVVPIDSDSVAFVDNVENLDLIEKGSNNVLLKKKGKRRKVDFTNGNNSDSNHLACESEVESSPCRKKRRKNRLLADQSKANLIICLDEDVLVRLAEDTDLNLPSKHRRKNKLSILLPNSDQIEDNHEDNGNINIIDEDHEVNGSINIIDEEFESKNTYSKKKSKKRKLLMNLVPACIDDQSTEATVITEPDVESENNESNESTINKSFIKLKKNRSNLDDFGDFMQKVKEFNASTDAEDIVKKFEENKEALLQRYRQTYLRKCLESTEENDARIYSNLNGDELDCEPVAAEPDVSYSTSVKKIKPVRIRPLCKAERIIYKARLLKVIQSKTCAHNFIGSNVNDIVGYGNNEVSS